MCKKKEGSRRVFYREKDVHGMTGLGFMGHLSNKPFYLPGKKENRADAYQTDMKATSSHNCKANIPKKINLRAKAKPLWKRNNWGEENSGPEKISWEYENAWKYVM